MPGNADKHAPVLSILCCARRIHVVDYGSVSKVAQKDARCAPGALPPPPVYCAAINEEEK